MEILTIPDKRLKKACPAYDVEDLRIDVESAEALKRHMMLFKHCSGLSANQVGIMKRFFVIRSPLRFYFDPRLVSHGRDLVIGNEGCMSVPKFIMAVPRWRVINVQYWNENYKLIETTLKGNEARVFQHLLDLLNGLLIVK